MYNNIFIETELANKYHIPNYLKLRVSKCTWSCAHFCYIAELSRTSHITFVSVNVHGRSYHISCYIAELSRTSHITFVSVNVHGRVTVGHSYKLLS